MLYDELKGRVIDLLHANGFINKHGAWVYMPEHAVTDESVRVHILKASSRKESIEVTLQAGYTGRRSTASYTEETLPRLVSRLRRGVQKVNATAAEFKEAAVQSSKQREEAIAAIRIKGLDYPITEGEGLDTTVTLHIGDAELTVGADLQVPVMFGHAHKRNIKQKLDIFSAVRMLQTLRFEANQGGRSWP